jgi:competence protein ComEA
LARSVIVGLALLTAAAFLQVAPARGQEPAVQLVDAPGKDVVVAVCSECHEPAPKIAKTRRTREQWSAVITDMEGRGLMADPKDLEVVLNYLAANYAPPPQ